MTSVKTAIENARIGRILNNTDHQVVRFELTVAQTQEVEDYDKRPNFFKARSVQNV